MHGSHERPFCSRTPISCSYFVFSDTLIWRHPSVKGLAPAARNCHSMTALPNGELAIVGGTDPSWRCLRDVHLLATRGLWAPPSLKELVLSTLVSDAEDEHHRGGKAEIRGVMLLPLEIREALEEEEQRRVMRKRKKLPTASSSSAYTLHPPLSPYVYSETETTQSGHS